ncbi:hypothetical protein [Flavobacterium sp. JP2137]|uniref:hypothetical protein n=1 Tax=Flavobacterium sp. JP2137 TaxID=3414510 RepID=UPI003D2FB5D6
MSLLIALTVLSCRDEKSVKKDRYKETPDETTRTKRSIHESNPKSEVTAEKMRNYEDLLKIQLHYASQAKTQAKATEVQSYASKLMVEYRNNRVEMEKLIGEELPRSSQDFAVQTSGFPLTLEATDSKDYDQVFLETLIKLQMETRDVLWQNLKNTSNNDVKTFYEKLSQEMELQIDYATTLLNKL